MQQPMTIDCSGLASLRTLERCSLKAYWDRNGYAAGYGHHGPDINESTTCTELEAENWLQVDTVAISASLSKLIKVSLTQGQFNVMVITTYNIGLGAFASSHILSRLNSGDYIGVPVELQRWVYSNHQIDEGLVTRRNAEIALWKEASQTQN